MKTLPGWIRAIFILNFAIYVLAPMMGIVVTRLWPPWNTDAMILSIIVGLLPAIVGMFLSFLRFDFLSRRKITGFAITSITCFIIVFLAIIFPLIYLEPPPGTVILLERNGEFRTIEEGTFVWLPSYQYELYSGYYTTDSTTGIGAIFSPQPEHVLDLKKQYGSLTAYHQYLEFLFHERVGCARELVGPEAAPACVLCALKDQDWKNPQALQYSNTNFILKI